MRVTGDAARGFRGLGLGVFGSTIAFMRGAWEVKSTQGDAAVAPAGEVNASMRLIETGRWRVGRHNAQRGWRPLCAHSRRPDIAGISFGADTPLAPSRVESG